MLQVLLIDDNPTQLKVRQAVLEQAGMLVSTAQTAEAAIESLRTRPHRFHVIVTDHMLPGDSGAAFVRQLRAIDHAAVGQTEMRVDSQAFVEGALKIIRN